MPYIQNDCSTLRANNQRFDAALNNIINWSTLPQNSIVGMKEALDMGYPVVINFAVYRSFDNMWNTNDVTIGYRGYHAACVVGYDDTKQMFKVQNSWGVSGGDNVFFLISYNLIQNDCLSGIYVPSGINQSAYPTISGSSTVYPSSSSTFTVSNPPVSYSWVYSPNLTLNSTSGNSATFISTSNQGSAWVGIKVGDFEVTRFNVQIYSPVSIDGPAYINTTGSITYNAIYSCPVRHSLNTWTTIQ